MTGQAEAAAALARLYQDLHLNYEDDLAAAPSDDAKRQVRIALDRANAAALAALANAFAVAQADMPVAVATLTIAMAELAAARAAAESFEDILTAMGAAVDAATALVGAVSPVS